MNRISKPCFRHIFPSLPARMSFFTQNDLIQSLKDEETISSPQVEQAMRDTDRKHYKGEYFDAPQSIGFEQTISAPHMHAICLEILLPLLQEGSNVLDVGSGSGYLTACMARIIGEKGKVTGVERIPELAERSIQSIRSDDLQLIESGRITIHNSDGWQGFEASGPYDAIHVGAAAVEVPHRLVEQLRVGGTLVIPVGEEGENQHLFAITKQEDGSVIQNEVCGVTYVPLVKE